MGKKPQGKSEAAQEKGEKEIVLAGSVKFGDFFLKSTKGQFSKAYLISNKRQSILLRIGRCNPHPVLGFLLPSSILSHVSPPSDSSSKTWGPGRFGSRRNHLAVPFRG